MSKGSYYVTACLQRLALPICLGTCILARQTALSAVYLALFFILPYVPLSTAKTFSGVTGHYLRAVFVISLLNVLALASFQIFLASAPNTNLLNPNCGFWEQILRTIGFIRLDGIDFLSALLYMSPDAWLLISSFVIYWVIRKMTVGGGESRRSSHNLGETSSPPTIQHGFSFLATKSKYLALLALLIAGALRPSVISGIYYLVFLGGATWWASYKELGRAFYIICRICSFIAALHAFALLSYQTQYLQELLPPKNAFARYFGLTALKLTKCDDPRVVNFNVDEWASVINPIAILCLYYILALQGSTAVPQKGAKDNSGEKGLARTLSQRLSQRSQQRRLARNPTMRWRSGNRKVRRSFSGAYYVGNGLAENTPLISSVTQPNRYRSTSIETGLKTDPHGSVTIANPVDYPNDTIAMSSFSQQEEDEVPSCMERAFDGIISLFQLLIRSSYIANNITMMAWSITFHSWLTFLLLLAASVLWMIPNQRQSMLRCSPYIVFYAELLLISQYIYGMNLTEKELPTKIDGVKLDQIGFSKPAKLPFNPIIIKTLFTCMFWITMRQFCQERWERKQSNALSALAGPLRVSVSTASAAPKEDSGAQWIQGAGIVLRKFMTKFWIWVVAISLFVIGITGKRITVFRIIYMGLFLIFILTFQISYRAWRTMMYGFWLTVIVYSMCILVLTYTYQFNNFPTYWEEYLKIPQGLQLDIGLELFETTELFIRLLAPTFFVVITVVQLHYFHQDFLRISDLRNRGASMSRSGKGSSRSDGSSAPEDPTTDYGASYDDAPLLGNKPVHFRSLRHLSSTEVKLLMKWFKEIFFNVIELIIFFLELHMLKIVLLSIILLCCYNVRATHLLLVLLCVAATLNGSKVQKTIAHICSVIIAVLLLLTMIYEIEYIHESDFISNCTQITTVPGGPVGFIANNTEWLGFKKAPKDASLLSQLQGYIGVFAVITAQAIVSTRQRIMRQETDRKKFHILFPGIGKDQADLNIRNCVKYLINYGFYKFGIEICLMTLVGVVGSRMDFYAVLYALWLCFLFGKGRVQLNSIWNSFTIFIACMICLQYVLVVGLPPGLCIDYPWYSSDIYRKVQKWGFLPDPISPPSAYKIVCDFILLLMVCRQGLVFRVEKTHQNTPYPGGSNNVVIQDYDKPGFVNPYLDHMTYTKSWLDLLKKGVFSGLLWVTLAVNFTAGTSRVNIFSLGYLIGAFVFLWQGNDLYLRPIPDILKSWDWLLGYNVVIILTKSLLQIAGCIFISSIHLNACWIVQLFGIGCVSKFGDMSDTLAPSKDAQCSVPDADIGLAWDGVCFGFLIMQRRFFNSYYFFHHIDETKAMTILQSRGAELIEELRQQQLQEQQEQERKVLEKIRRKMDRIKASQQKVQSAKEPGSHYQEAQAPLACQSPGVSSVGTPRGYHTPISEEEPPRSFLQAPTPSSAILTVSLDGYLEPQRMSFSSPPASELLPRVQSPDESFPVFSPPPYGAVVGHHGRGNIHAPPYPWSTTPRHSIVSQSSHHTCDSYYGVDVTMAEISRRLARKSRHRAIRSGDYYMFDDIDDEELDLIKEDDDESASEADEMNAKGFTMSKFFSTAMKTDITKAADQALTAEDVPSTSTAGGSSRGGGTRQRRASMPASMLRRKSSFRTRPGATASVISAPSQSSASGVAAFSPGLRARMELNVPTGPGRSPASSLTGSPKPPRELRIQQREDSLSDDDIKETAPEPVKEKITQRLWQSFKVLWAFLESMMVSMIRTLNRISRDYRYVVRVLAQEKRELKESSVFNEGNRSGTAKIWKPRLEVMMHLSEIMTTSPRGSVKSKSPENTEQQAESLITKEEAEKLNRQALSTITEDLEKERENLQRRGRFDSLVPDIRIIAASLERGLEDNGSVFTLSSSDPDSAKEEWSAAQSPVWLQLLLSTWYAIISHSELVCYFVIFLHQIQSPTLLSLPLPLMVFLWGSLTMPRPTKTFWITLVAYTEVVVVLKCLFQFEILPWNQTPPPVNNPFFPPRIIGVEKKNPYASSDLILLLIIFFHRYMLKSLGLWKSSFEEVASSLASSSGDDTIKISSKEEESQPTALVEQSISEEKSDSLTQELPGKGDQSLEEPPASCFQKKLICIGRGDDNENPEDLLPYVRASRGTFDKFPIYIHKAGQEYCSTTKHFFGQLLDSGWRLSADVYAYMFICDFFNFLVVLFGFSAFGTQQGDGGVSAYLEENKVPVPFLLMMILQFALIVIDRALYLRKYILGKIVFQFILVIGVHIWMFFVLPAITERSFNSLLPPQMWYMVKCFYMLMSAYQIRAGYPARILGNFLCKKYNYFNMFSFKGFMAVPFLFELRALMDWIWTDTSMTLSDWMKMEDIFSQIFQLKCQRRAEAEYPLPRGQKKSTLSKYMLGGAGLFLIIAIIWFPLVLFALGNTVGEPNVPYDVTITLRIGAYQYIYEMSAQNNTIYKYNEGQFEVFDTIYKKEREALTFLSNYQFNDVAIAKLSGNSTVVWGISPPDRRLLLEEVESNKTLTIKFSWKVSRVSNNPEMIGIVQKDQSIYIPPDENGSRNLKRIELAEMLRGNSSNSSSFNSITIPNIFPKFLKITNKGDADPISKFMEGNKEESTFRNLTIRLLTGLSSTGAEQQWWEVREACNDENYKSFLSHLPLNECNQFLTIFTFNDKTFPATLSFISGKGIIGLYVSIVFVMSTVVRGMFTGISSKIMFDDMPNVDRILQLCLDIYLVRESNEFALEEDLFAKLVFLYRSPETIIKWTREREDDWDEDGEGSPLPSIAN